MTAPEASATSLVDAWRAGRMRRDTALAHLALGALIAAATATSRPRRVTAAAACVAVFAACLSRPSVPSWLVLAVPLLLVAQQRLPAAASIAVALACASPCLAAGPGLGLPMTAAAALGTLAGLGAPVSRTVAVPVAALAAIALAAWGR